MAQLSEHPSVIRFRERADAAVAAPPLILEARELRQICLDAGADDVGFVQVERPELADQRADILQFFPHTKSLISFVRRMNCEPIHNPARSVANVEFHQMGDLVNETAHHIVAALDAKGIRAINPAMGFPMEVGRGTGNKLWVVSHKPVAVAAGLGHMGIHRNVIHPKFGNFILLGTVLLEAVITEYQQPLDYNPCLECKLCVSACPAGAIGSEGEFNFSACYTHNYREFLGGFTNWVEQIADSHSAAEYRQRVTDEESASMWQSLSFEANYKSAYCMAVCPAGDDVLAPFLTNRADYLKDVLRPLQEKEPSEQMSVDGVLGAPMRPICDFVVPPGLPLEAKRQLVKRVSSAIAEACDLPREEVPLPSGKKVATRWVLGFFREVPLEQASLDDLMASENPMVLESLEAAMQMQEG